MNLNTSVQNRRAGASNNLTPITDADPQKSNTHNEDKIMSSTNQVPVLFNNTQDGSNLRHWNNKPVTVIGIVANPDDNSIIDAECMPQIQIKLNETGEITTAYVDEIPEQHWPKEMQAVIDGQNAYGTNKENPYTGDLKKFFEYGLVLADIKGLTNDDH